MRHTSLSAQNTILPQLGADIRPPQPERHVPLTIQPDGSIGRPETAGDEGPRLGISPQKHALIVALQIGYTLDVVSGPPEQQARS